MERSEINRNDTIETTDPTQGTTPEPTSGAIRRVSAASHVWESVYAEEPNGQNATRTKAGAETRAPALPAKKRGPKPGTRPRRPLMGTTSTVMLDHLQRAYLDDLRVRNYKPKTLQGYDKNLGAFVRWAAESEGATTLADLDADLVKKYIRFQLHKPKFAERGYTHPKWRDQHIKPSAIRNYVRDLKTFASWLAHEGYTPTNVLASVHLPKVDDTPIEPFTDEELHTIFSSFDTSDAFDLRDYVICQTLFDTGMRVGEFVHLTLDDVDLARMTIRIAHAKFGKWRDIGFGKETHKYLTRYLSLCRPDPVIEGDRHLFLAVDGYPMTEQTVQQLFLRLSKRIGVHVHAHRFRHTFAVNMLKAGTDLRTLQRLMGHADIRILARYLNLASEDAIQTHHTNSPADRFKQRELQNGAGRQRLAFRRQGPAQYRLPPLAREE